MYAHIHSKPGMCSDDGRAITLGWYVQTSPRRDAHFWSDPHYFPTEEAARAWCAEKKAEVLSVSWM